MIVRRAVFAALVLALIVPAVAPARRTPLTGPNGVRAFLLNYDEPVQRTFSRTPSFAWKPIPRALNYEFQLSTASSFRENSILWSSETLKQPAVSVPLALPWATGKPYSFFVRVRARTQRGTTRWSKDFGFNVRWPRIPADLPAPNGLLRWTQVDGANAYEVFESTTGDPLLSSPDLRKSHLVGTNVTDVRDWATLHFEESWMRSVYWRVRAVRVSYYPIETAAMAAQNGQTSQSYGPWSPVFHTAVTIPPDSPLMPDATASDTLGTALSPAAHTIMPGLAWRGKVTFGDLGIPTHLSRVYIFSDRDCTQPVFTGSIVSGNAWVPRLTGALVLPRSVDAVAKASAVFMADGDQGLALTFDLHQVIANESAAGASSGAGGASSTPATQIFDLWDRKWPSSPYYWTVVPVRAYLTAAGPIAYIDAVVPQDACAEGRIGSFGKISKAVPTTGKKAYVIGLSAEGRMKSAAATRSPRVYGPPILTWMPVPGAQAYEIQLSRTQYPFRPKALVGTYATSVDTRYTLDRVTGEAFALTSGTWFYRVRGLTSTMPAGAQGLAWSSVRKFDVAKPVFAVR